ncbi:MAG: DUF2384 domain-containing protein [Leadbetterella sp.]|nr:DUF2384 domain-containing protein [Leadbetterella sp.]
MSEDPVKYETKYRAKEEEESSKLMVSDSEVYYWNTRMDRVNLVRRGVSYHAIEAISKKMNTPVKDMLVLLDIPQTTYNKKKRENSLLSGRDSEFILLLSELTDFGREVFNGEEAKFSRWLKKPNLSLGGLTPESLLDSVTGIQEVKNALNRLEYGSLA